MRKRRDVGERLAAAAQGTNGPLEDWAAFAFAGRASRQVLHLLISSGRVSRPFQTAGACDKPPPPHLNFTNCLQRRRLRGSIRLLSSPGPFPSLPATPAYDSTYLFGLLPPTQLSITNTTPRRAPFASHAIPLRVPADRLDLPVGTACLHLKLLGALQTSDGPSFGAKSYPHLLESFQAHRSRLHPSICLPASLLAVVLTERPGSRSPQRAERVTLQLGRPDALSLFPSASTTRRSVLGVRRATCSTRHWRCVFVSIIIKRTQSECDVAHKVQRQSSAESAWRIPNAVLVAKDVVISIITKGFQPVFLRRINHAAGVWSSASVSQDDFSSYFVSTARNIRLVKLSLMNRTAAGTSQRETLALILSPPKILSTWNSCIDSLAPSTCLKRKQCAKRRQANGQSPLLQNNDSISMMKPRRRHSVILLHRKGEVELDMRIPRVPRIPKQTTRPNSDASSLLRAVNVVLELFSACCNLSKLASAPCFALLGVSTFHCALQHLALGCLSRRASPLASAGLYCPPRDTSKISFYCPGPNRNEVLTVTISEQQQQQAKEYRKPGV
ncbi:uncharacterized protein CLUP02_09051 [Colletotrichum lupini]|uniref:Uncharacterized protein n=1 Tax=Colletotrichum lupini TaxID=145971 RepID=A0A9Q8WI14_9PEZI|nr:uncharacterized protein CLUP02_09051 [Colletotrichum lupini]UQC83557.1 hypothetical protein CLUP02_09051 [Colletotrichum lupini]